MVDRAMTVDVTFDERLMIAFEPAVQTVEAVDERVEQPVTGLYLDNRTAVVVFRRNLRLPVDTISHTVEEVSDRFQALLDVASTDATVSVRSEDTVTTELQETGVDLEARRRRQ